MRAPSQGRGSSEAAEPETAVPASLGRLQAAVMEEVWAADESSVREVTARLEARANKLAYTTVLTVMIRLHARGLLARRREGRRDLYRATIEPAELSAALTREAVDRLIDAHGDEAVAAFAARMRDGDPDELTRLRELLDRDGL